MRPWATGRVRQVSSRHRRQAAPSFIPGTLQLLWLGPEASQPLGLPAGATKMMASDAAAGVKGFGCGRDTLLGLNACRVIPPSGGEGWRGWGNCIAAAMGLQCPSQHPQAGRDAKGSGQLDQNLGVLLGLIALGKISPANMSCTNLMFF